MDKTKLSEVKPRLPKCFQYLIPLIDTVADMEGSAKASEVVSKMMEAFQKTSKPSSLLMQIYEAKAFLTKAGYLVTPQRGVWNLTRKARTQPIRLSDLPEIHQQNRGWRSYWFDEQHPQP
jgi:hypothetical protein